LDNTLRQVRDIIAQSNKVLIGNVIAHQKEELYKYNESLKKHLRNSY